VAAVVFRREARSGSDAHEGGGKGHRSPEFDGHEVPEDINAAMKEG
jgi:hypothetical protein